MQAVQPIRDIDKLEQLKNELRRQSYRDWFMFMLGINSGLRISDILNLRVSDVRGKTHLSIREKKTDKSKRFNINNTLRSIIDEYTNGLSDNAWLFPSQKGQGDKPITRIQAYRILNKAADKVSLDEIGTHTMRKTFGYHFYKRTKDVALLQEIFNHSAPSITLRYIGINQDVIDQALEDFSL